MNELQETIDNALLKGATRFVECKKAFLELLHLNIENVITLNELENISKKVDKIIFKTGLNKDKALTQAIKNILPEKRAGRIIKSRKLDIGKRTIKRRKKCKIKRRIIL